MKTFITKLSETSIILTGENSRLFARFIITSPKVLTYLDTFGLFRVYFTMSVPLDKQHVIVESGRSKETVPALVRH